MSISDFIGMRRATIKNNATGGTATFVVLGADKIGADGLTVILEVNEGTMSSFAGDIAYDNGTNISAGALQLIPRSVEDLGKIWPAAYDATAKSFQPPIGGCTSQDCTLAYEKVCDTKANVILRHCSLALAFEMALTRDDAFAVEVGVYPSLSPGSEYGLTGDNADQMFPFQVYDGTYDPSTDTVTFDAAAPSS